MKEAPTQAQHRQLIYKGSGRKSSEPSADNSFQDPNLFLEKQSDSRPYMPPRRKQITKHGYLSQLETNDRHNETTKR